MSCAVGQHQTYCKHVSVRSCGRIADIMFLPYTGERCVIVFPGKLKIYLRWLEHNSNFCLWISQRVSDCCLPSSLRTLDVLLWKAKIIISLYCLSGLSSFWSPIYKEKGFKAHLALPEHFSTLVITFFYLKWAVFFPLFLFLDWQKEEVTVEK